MEQADESLQSLRAQVLEAYEKRTKEMISTLDLSGNNYSFWDYIQFSLITLMYASGAIRETQYPVKHLLRVYIDGDIQTTQSLLNNKDLMKEMKERLNNGILSFPKE